MIELVLLTGFLGAGKTTLMTSILDTYKNNKVGVIVNEFGKINIDAKLIKKDGIEMAELSNGSIFCACIKDKFVDSLIEMSNSDLEYMFIEASGLADPSNMPQILNGIEHKTFHKYHYKGAICVVDGENFIGLLDLLPAVHRQVEYGDAVIINKADLISQEEIINISHRIQSINPNASIIVTSYCRVNIKEIIETFNTIIKEGKETTNTVGSRPNTFILVSEDILSYDYLKEFLYDIAKNTYRIKGFSQTDEGPVEISGVVNHIHLNEWHEEISGSEIVIISAVGIRMLSIITAALEKNLKGKLHL